MHRKSILFVAILLLCSGLAPVCSADAPPVPSPVDPLPSDPELAQVDDQRLKDLYLEATIAVRTAAQDASSPEDGRNRVNALKAQPRTAGDRTYIAECAMAAAQVHDWPTYRTAVWAAKVGMTRDNAMVDAIRAALKAPRAEKMSDPQGRAISDSLEALGELNTERAIKLLEDCTRAAFWGDEPMRSVALRTNTRESVIMVRTLAVTALGKADPALAIPALEKLAEQYPDRRPVAKPTDEYEFEDGIGYTIAEYLWKVRKDAGMPTGLHPLEEHLGMSFEEYLERNPIGEAVP